ncbi:MAG: hypothetical protein H6719_28445 [Sandaracinaceae bacterium]|nr:hypothetical protein [Sandaracinaceae bacterium]
MARPVLMRGACAALLLAGCTATVPDGQIVCSVASPECPEGFVCCPAAASGAYDGVCTTQACGDAGPGDAGPSADAGFDAGVVDVPDAGFDAGFDAGPPPPPVPEEVAAGGSHTCLRLSDGRILCWGSNASGQLGQGTESTAPRTTPIAVMGIDGGALEVEASAEATCARFADRIRCWGSNAVAFSVGPIGSDVERSPIPLDVELAGTTPVQLVMGQYHACAIMDAARTLECWGHNGDGQLGVGTRRSEAIPVAVPMLAGVADVCAGAQHTCAALADGTLYCWGNADKGQLGIGEPGTPTVRTSPTLVPLADVVDVECGYFHTCAITDDGTTRQTWCWGENRSGETAQDELTNPVLEPTAFLDASGASVERIAIGGGTQFFSVTYGFTLVTGPTLPLRGFGNNSSGQLGLGGVGPTMTSTPMPVLEVEPAILDVSAGAFHACAIDEAAGVRRVLCWGDGGNGRLGNAAERSSDRPVAVFGYDGT